MKFKKDHLYKISSIPGSDGLELNGILICVGHDPLDTFMPIEIKTKKIKFGWPFTTKDSETGRLYTWEYVGNIDTSPEYYL